MNMNIKSNGDFLKIEQEILWNLYNVLKMSFSCFYIWWIFFIIYLKLIFHWGLTFTHRMLSNFMAIKHNTGITQEEQRLHLDWLMGPPPHTPQVFLLQQSHDQPSHMRLSCQLKKSLWAGSLCWERSAEAFLRNVAATCKNLHNTSMH